MVSVFGMDDDFGLLSVPELLKHAEAVSSPMYLRVNQAAAEVLRQEMERTLALLEQNRTHLDAVLKALFAKNRLYSKDLEELLPPARPREFKAVDGRQ